MVVQLPGEGGCHERFIQNQRDSANAWSAWRRRRVRDTRIAVSVLVDLRRQGRSEKQLLGDFPQLSKSDLAAAWEYYREHASEIDRTILAEAGEE